MSRLCTHGTASTTRRRRAVGNVMCPDSVSALIVNYMKEHGLPDLFKRNNIGNLYKGRAYKYSVERAKLWVWLRSLPNPPSYPEIAAFHGGAHSSVVEAVQRYNSGSYC